MTIRERLLRVKQLTAQNSKLWLRLALNPFKEHAPQFLTKIAFDNESHDLNIALIKAVKERKFLSASKLIQRGANPNIQSSIGNTLLINAVIYDDFVCCKFLIRHGANLEIKNKDGLTALDLAENLANDRLQLLLLEKLNGVSYKIQKGIIVYGWKIIALLLVIKFASFIFHNVSDNGREGTFEPKQFKAREFKPKEFTID